MPQSDHTEPPDTGPPDTVRQEDIGPDNLVAGGWARDVLTVSGPDAVSFLQGQVSADVEALAVGQSTLALLLEPTGKMQALLRLWRTDDQIVFIDTDPGAAGAVEKRLRRFLLRTDAAIEALDWQCMAVRGPGSNAVDASSSGAVLVGPGMWPGMEGIDLLGPVVEVPPGVEPAAEGLMEALRLRAGWPTAGAEITGDVIPAEIGSWLITASVSFTKGCYVGQELTARIDSRGGNVPRNLRRFEISHDASVGDEVTAKNDADGGPVGTITSAAPDPGTGTTVALGFVKRGVAEDAELEVAAPTR